MIRVSDDYVIDVDSMEYTVKRDEHRTYFNKAKNEEAEFYTTLAYFGKLEHAIRYVAERMAKDKIMSRTGDITLSEAIRETQIAYKYVSDAIEKNIQ